MKPTGLSIVLAAIAVLLGIDSVLAQTYEPMLNRLDESRSKLVEAGQKYNESAQQLLHLEEEEVNKVSKQVEQMRQLLAEGLVTRLDVQKFELTLAVAQARVEATTQQLANYEGMLAEIKEAAEAHTLRAQSSNRAPSLAVPTILRYNGLANWSPANLGSIEAFFSTKFGRALPTSVVGQGAIHNQWGFDHRKAVDVSLHPDSVEGKALINYLQSQGIPFLVFRTSIPGMATGPHIHIGNPSHRIRQL